MRCVVVGATGNVGSSVIAALSADERVSSVVGVARRPSAADLPKVRWAAADIRRDPLAPLFEGADAVIHLAWLIQPSKRPDVLASVNVRGSARVFDAVAQAEVPSLVYASSVGAYSPAASRDPVDESWPVDGIPSCPYSRDKAAVECMLDDFEGRHEQVRTVRLRPALTFKRTAGAQITGYFIGWPRLPRLLPRRVPVLPFPDGLALQAVHSHDVAAAYVAALFSDVGGAFNIAADPVIDARTIAAGAGLRTVAVPPRAVRAAMNAAWRAGLQPTDPSWLDMAMNAPLMDTSRARDELGWRPRHGSLATVAGAVDGIRHQTDLPTPSLRPR